MLGQPHIAILYGSYGALARGYGYITQSDIVILIRYTQIEFRLLACFLFQMAFLSLKMASISSTTSTSGK